MSVLDSLGLGSSGNSGDSSLTPESIAQRRRLAEALLQQGQTDAPVRHWSQGANRVLQSMLGTYRLGQLDKQDQAGTAAANSQIASIFGGGAAKPASPAITPAAPTGRELPAMQPPSDGQRLPMGMRVNNPGNIKYNPRLGYAGMQGPSQHTDQGDPQMTFDTPQNGMNAAARLALTKYARGQTSAASIVAGEGGWTPGNNEAAANIAKTMGVAPDEDLRLSDPARMSAFLRALTMQEHGQASGQYTPEMYQTAATAVGGPAGATPQPAAPSAAPAADALMPPSGASQLQRQAVELMKNPRNAPLGRELLIKAALAEAPKQPEAVQEYALAVKQGYSKPFMDYQIEMKKAGQPERGLQIVAPGGTAIDAAGNPVFAAPPEDKAPPAYRTTPDGNLEAIPGGPATKLSGDQAGRIAMMRNARGGLEQAKKFFSDMGVSGRAGKIFNMGEAGEAERTVSTAIEATLRALTGAAATTDEVNRLEKLFAPTIYDSPKTRGDKLQKLEAFINEAEGVLLQGHGGMPPPQGAPGATGGQRTDDPLGILD